jgi:hypothetical protein
MSDDNGPALLSVLGNSVISISLLNLVASQWDAGLPLTVDIYCSEIKDRWFASCTQLPDFNGQ